MHLAPAFLIIAAMTIKMALTCTFAILTLTGCTRKVTVDGAGLVLDKITAGKGKSGSERLWDVLKRMSAWVA